LFSRANAIGAAPSRTELPPPWLPWFGVAAAAALAQSALPKIFGPGTLHASIVGLCVLWFGFAGGPLRGFAFGAAAGLIEDALGGSAIAWAVANALCGTLAGVLRRTIVAESVVFMSVAAAVLTFVRVALFGLIVRAENSPSTTAPFAIWPVVLEAAVSGLLALAALVLAGRIQVQRGDA
jgi:hypothetical protein